MSAFVVSNETMDRVVTAIVNTWSSYGRLPVSFNPFAGPLIGSDARNTELGRQLFAMNIEAVQARYGQDTEMADDAIISDYTFSPSLDTDIGLYKALKCLSYQCSEGDVHNTDLFKALERTIERVSSDIISDLPEFQNAKWD